MRLMERVYRSPLGRLLSLAGRCVAAFQRPFMVYGYKEKASGKFRKYTRFSSNVVVLSEEKLSVGENVWVWHHSILDATEGITIEDGCQIGAWVGIFTHGSEASIRLLGPEYVNIPNAMRKGYTRGAVRIGAYSFVGAGSKILPGVSVGKGCLIAAGTLVTKSVPDYSIVAGQPGQVRGSTVDFDRKFFASHDFSETYYDADALRQIKEGLAAAEGKGKA